MGWTTYGLEGSHLSLAAGDVVYDKASSGLASVHVVEQISAIRVSWLWVDGS